MGLVVACGVCVGWIGAWLGVETATESFLAFEGEIMAENHADPKNKVTATIDTINDHRIVTDLIFRRIRKESIPPKRNGQKYNPIPTHIITITIFDHQALLQNVLDPCTTIFSVFIAL